MRVLHLAPFLQGGAGLAISDLASSQAAFGHDVAVVTSATGAPGYGNYPSHLDTLARAGVPVVTVDSLFKRDLPQNLAAAGAVMEIAGGGGFDVIHTHAAIPSLIALMVAGRSTHRTPIVQTMHGWGLAKSAADEQTDVALLNLVDRVVVPSGHSAALLRRLGVSRPPISIVPYGVRDEPRMTSATADPLLDELRGWRADGGTVLCCVGTIGARKNQALVIDALRMIESRDRLLCVFVGDGDAAGLRERAAAAGVESCIRIAGYRDDARPFLTAADAFVLPSLSEGQPLSILEAWRDRLPVIVSDIPELAELVDDGVTGFLFDPHDPRALASAVWAADRLTPDARARLGARVRRTYETRFTADAMGAGYMNEYAAVGAVCNSIPARVRTR